MKTLFLTTSILAALAMPALAGTTEDTTGCATKTSAQGGFTIKVDPNCNLGNEPSGDASLLLAAAFAFDAVNPDEEEPAAE
jgi:hypothetical protein